MFIPKSPQIGGLVRPHQDSTFIRSTPKPCIALWFALEDADEKMVHFGSALDPIMVRFDNCTIEEAIRLNSKTAIRPLSNGENDHSCVKRDLHCFYRRGRSRFFGEQI